MQIKHYTITERDKWDAFVAQEPNFSLLQSWSWGEFKEKLGWQVFRVAVEENGQILGGAQILVKPFPGRFVSMAYVPRGPFGNWLDEPVASLLLPELHRIAKRQRAIFLKIEPSIHNNLEIDQILQYYGFKSSPYTNQPRATIILDLTQSLDDIFKQVRKTTRMYIRSAVEKGVIVRPGTRADLPAFYNIMLMTARRGKFSPRNFDYYAGEWQTFAEKNQAGFLMAFFQEHLLVVRMFYRFGSHAATFHSGSSGEYSELRSNNLLAWEAIKWAKEQGCTTYDLWGIPDEVGQAIFEGNEPPVSDRTDGLWGVYRFKSGFSKNIVYYIGAYDYVYNAPLYLLITNRLINSAKLEQISSWLDSRGSK